MAKRKEDVKKIEFGSEQHVAALENAYGVRKNIAEKVVKQFESGEREWDITFYDKCKRFMDVISKKPEPTSPREGWKRTRGY